MSDTPTPAPLSIDVEDLTIEEVEIIEEITDAAIDSLFAPGAKKGKTLRALAFVAARREDPNVTIEEVGSRRLDLAATDPS